MRTRRRGVRASLLVALVAVIALLINGAAVYFLPTYANALGHIPGAGALVKWSGLGVGDVNVIYATAAHGGVRLSVTAAFADENHTLLTIEVYGPRSSPGVFDSLVLTDQFGHAYSQQGFEQFAVTNLTDGGTPDYFDFSPISGPAAAIGAGLTLHSQRLEDRVRMRRRNGSGHREGARHMRWARLSLRLIRPPSSDAAPADVDGLRYSFPRVSITDSKLVEIVMDADGSVLPGSIFGWSHSFLRSQRRNWWTQLVTPSTKRGCHGSACAPSRMPISRDLDSSSNLERLELFLYGVNDTSIERELVVR